MNTRAKHQGQSLFNSKFLRNAAIVAGGTATAQAITMAFAPIITRIYGPEAFGRFGVYMALAAMLSPIAALTYPIAIVLPKEDAYAQGLARLSLYIAFGVSAFIALAFMFGGEWLLVLLGAETVTSFAILIPIAIFFAACMQIAQQWLIRKKEYRVTARVSVFQALILNSTMAGIGWFYSGEAVLILVATAGHVLYAAMLWTVSNRGEVGKRICERHVNISLKKLAMRHCDFPLYRAPQVFINAISHSGPILMLGTFFGPASAGFYSICKTALEMPSQLISKSVGDIFYPRIAEASHNGENLTNLIVKATLFLAAIGFVPFALVVALGPWIFTTLFGAKWAMAGEYAKWLSIMMFFFFINKPCVVSVPVLGIQKGLFIYELFSISSKFAAIYVGMILFDDDILAVALFSIFGSIAYVLLIVWVLISSITLCRRVENASKTS